MRNNFTIVYHCSVIVRHCYSSFLTMANKIGNDWIQRNWIRSVCFEFCQLSRDATFKRGAFGRDRREVVCTLSKPDRRRVRAS
jgi:hypothetical protein